MRKMVLGIIILLLALVTVGCKKQEATTQTADVTGKATQTVGEYKCEDSDGGIVAEKAGKVTGLDNDEGYVYYDKCYPPSPFLVEYYCEGNEWKNQNVRCSEGTKCLGGLCRAI